MNTGRIHLLISQDADHRLAYLLYFRKGLEGALLASAACVQLFAVQNRFLSLFATPEAWGVV